MQFNSEAECVCSVENLSIAIDGERPVQLVKPISFEIHKGDYFALVGESGSGKSLLAHSIVQTLRSIPNI